MACATVNLFANAFITLVATTLLAFTTTTASVCTMDEVGAFQSVPMNTMGLTGINRRWANTSENVLFERDQAKMIRIHTTAISANMIEVVRRRKSRMLEQLPCYSMRVCLFALPDNSSVAVSCETVGPQPTSCIKNADTVHQELQFIFALRPSVRAAKLAFTSNVFDTVCSCEFFLTAYFANGFPNEMIVPEFLDLDRSHNMRTVSALG